MSLEAILNKINEHGASFKKLVEEVQGLQRETTSVKAKDTVPKYRVTAWATQLPPGCGAEKNRLPFYFAAGWGWPRAMDGVKATPATHEVTETGLQEMLVCHGSHLSIETVEEIDPVAEAKRQEEKELATLAALADKYGKEIGEKRQPQQAQEQPKQQQQPQQSQNRR